MHQRVDFDRLDSRIAGQRARHVPGLALLNATAEPDDMGLARHRTHVVDPLAELAADDRELRSGVGRTIAKADDEAVDEFRVGRDLRGGCGGDIGAGMGAKGCECNECGKRCKSEGRRG